MKKYNLFKVIAITIATAWLLTLFIPGSYVDYSGKIMTNAISSTGIWGLFSNLSVSISYFNGIALLLIATACLYSVLNKVSVYERFVNKTASLFEGKQSLLVIITTILFAILSLFVSEFLVLIVFMPFVYTIMKKLDIDKKVILSSTIVASILGFMCGIYNDSLFSMFGLNINTLLLVKIIVLFVSLITLIFFIAPKKSSKSKDTKKAQKTKNVKVVKTSDKDSLSVNKTVYLILTILLGTFGINKFYAKKIKQGILCILFSWTLIPTILSIAEFITLLTIKKDKEGKINVNSSRLENVKFGVLTVIFTIVIIASVIPWESLFEDLKVFTDFNTWLSKIKIGDYAVFSNIIGSPVMLDSTTGSTTGVLNVFGSWMMTDVAILLFIITLVTGLASKIKFNDLIATVTDGTKKILPVSITAMLLSIVLVTMVTTGVNITISNAILSLTKGFNIATATLTSMIGSVLTGDFYYFVSTVGSVFKVVVTNKDYLGIVAFVMQSVFNLMMIIAPTSVGLIIGLYYLNIPYNKWFKFIWKVLLIIFVIVIITSIILYAII